MMDSGSGSTAGGCDPTLKYCTLVEGNRNDIICNFYGMVYAWKHCSHIKEFDP